ASAKEYENFIGCVTVSFDAANQIVEKKASLINADEAKEKYTPVNAVTAKIAALEAEQGKILDVVVAKLGYSLSSAREPGVRTQEMPLGNMAADALKAGTNAQIALTNGGGLRADLKEGDISVRAIIAVLPFGNYGVTKYVTPAQLKTILENGVDSAPAAVGKFPQIAGFTFTYDVGAPAGNRVTAISIGGTPVSLTDTATKFLMATNDFMAVGGDEYTTFASIPTENEFNALDEMLLSYIKANPDKIYAEAEGRITVAAVTVPAEVGEPPVTSAPPAAEPPPVTAPPPPASGTGVVVNCYYLNVRTGHGPAYNAFSYLTAGDRVTVLDSQYGWYLIDNGKVKGWVYSAYLQVS
ncbi:MAG: 5'-nucleotidase C-terminal domain-containing protein, partial [Oscillospiraceae bacterium]|nr:5'-nucleotidase C-terminal domain-containing protein [Oscillospiraceae bacterium]